MGNVDRHRAAHDAFNARNMPAMRSMMTEDLVFEDRPRGITMKSSEEFVEWAREWTTAMSDAAVSEPTYYDAGDTTIARFTGKGINDGPMGPVSATGRRLSLDFCEILHWNADGKAERGEVLYDQMTLLVQLGVAEPPPQ